MDISSELVHGLLPIFMTASLGASVALVGLVEGVAESFVTISKLFSGVLSDWIGKRKLLVLIGYGLAALTKPVFPLANSIATVSVARVVDRIGKGIRGAPRDALVAEIAPPHLLGASFGLRQSLDTVGAVLGPLLAIGLMFAFKDNIRAVLWFAVLPAAFAIFTLARGVEEPDNPRVKKKAQFPLKRSELARLGSPYWGVVAVGGVIALARFSEAFLILRSQSLGLRIAYAPLALVVMSLVYTVSAYPAGVLSDRISRRAILVAGLAVLVGADVTLALAQNVSTAMLGVALWGLHMGLSQGILSTLVADSAPTEVRGTAFGLFGVVTGVFVLLSSALAGILWDRFGPPATFWTGGGFAVVAMIGLLVLGQSLRPAKSETPTSPNLSS